MITAYKSSFNRSPLTYKEFMETLYLTGDNNNFELGPRDYSENLNFSNNVIIMEFRDILECLDELSNNNLKNIEKVNPEIILFVGDLRNDDGPPAGWFEMTEFLGKDRIRIAVGNHDIVHQNEYQTYYNLPKEFYSFDFGNVHFIILATDSNISTAGEQFQFLDIIFTNIDCFF